MAIPLPVGLSFCTKTLYIPLVVLLPLTQLPLLAVGSTLTVPSVPIVVCPKKAKAFMMLATCLQVSILKLSKPVGAVVDPSPGVVFKAKFL